MSVLRAELLRTRRSTPAYLLWVGPVVALLSVAGQLLVSRQRSWSSLLMWHVGYVTAFAAVLVALLVAFVERRERRSRGGGTGWRATRPSATRAARLVVLAGLSLAASLLVFLPYAPAGMVLGFGAPPLAVLTSAALLVWAGGLCWLVAATAAARLLGPWPVVGLGVAWQVVGTVSAESDTWWLVPPAWAVRPVLPLIGVHFNGVPLEPGSPVWSLPWWPPVLASVLLAAVLVPAAVSGPLRPGPVIAVATSLRRTAIGPLAGAALLVLVAVAVVYPVQRVVAVFGLAVLPGGSAALAILAWQAQEPAWRVVLTRGAHAPRDLLGVLGAVVVVVTVVVAGLLVVAGAPVGDAALHLAVAVPLGWAVLAVTLWLQVRLHVAVAAVAGLLGVTGGVLFGGSVLAATPLWLAGPAAWALSAATPDRAALAVAVSLAVALVAGAGFVRTASRG